MKVTDPEIDPKGLIHDCYQIEGITASQCRSVFLDWALSLPDGQETGEALRRLLDRYGMGEPDHPMTEVLQQGLSKTEMPRRRGGWRSRPRD